LEVVTGKKISLNKKDPEFIDLLINKYYPAEKTDSRSQEQFFQGDADVFFVRLFPKRGN